MLKWKRWGVALALAMVGGQALANAAPATEEQVRQLLDVVGVGKMLAQMNTQAVTTLQQSMPCVAPDFWQNYMDANQTQLFIGRLVPVYQHHFTADELEGLLKFYRSPLGQKVVNEMPVTMAEASQAGQQWSHERSDQMIAELKQMGSLDASGRCPAKVAPAAVAGAEEGEAAPSGKAAPSKAKAAPHKAPAKPVAKKPAAKPAAKKPATAGKAPAKTGAKPATAASSAKTGDQATPGKAPAQGGSTGGQ